ncbi:hypothetical protein CRUP_021079 [Coryphaenoides rupestris]|nr:hypothetical protein CRUP_021079 [Coryphaenoides rupestris]
METHGGLGKTRWQRDQPGGPQLLWSVNRAPPHHRRAPPDTSPPGPDWTGLETDPPSLHGSRGSASLPDLPGASEPSERINASGCCGAAAAARRLTCRRAVDLQAAHQQQQQQQQGTRGVFIQVFFRSQVFDMSVRFLQVFFRSQVFDMSPSGSFRCSVGVCTVKFIQVFFRSQVFDMSVRFLQVFFRSQGGYMAAKVSKLQEQFHLDAPREKQKEGSGSQIFHGVAIYVNGYTEPGVDELRRLMMLHGGQFNAYYSRSKTTHIIANNLTTSKIKELRGEKVVRPAWITDRCLYAKQKCLKFSGVGLLQNQDAAGPSLRPPPKQNLHLNRPGLNAASGCSNGSLHHHKTSSTCRRDSIAQSRLDRPEAGASSPPSNPIQADPYMFPHSPPGPGDPGPASPGRPGSRQAREKRLKPPPPTYQEAVAATQSQPPPPSLPPPPPLSPPPPHPCRLASLTEKPQHSSSSRSPVRLNGSHHYAFSSGLAAPRQCIAPPGLAPPPDSSPAGGKYVNDLHSRRRHSEGDASLPGRERLRRHGPSHESPHVAPLRVPSCILHVDMDCFFVSVSIRDRPDLKGESRLTT